MGEISLNDDLDVAAVEFAVEFVVEIVADGEADMVVDTTRSDTADRQQTRPVVIAQELHWETTKEAKMQLLLLLLVA